jgi:hypothetical protein
MCQKPKIVPEKGLETLIIARLWILKIRINAESVSFSRRQPQMLIRSS